MNKLPISTENSSSQFRQSTQTNFLLLVLLFVFSIAIAILVFKNNQLKYFLNNQATPTRKQNFTPTIQQSKEPLPTLSPSKLEHLKNDVSTFYTDSLKQLESELSLWDKNWLVRFVSIKFGGTWQELKKMYVNNQINPSLTFWVYSPAHEEIRDYQINREGYSLSRSWPEEEAVEELRTLVGSLKIPVLNPGKAINNCYQQLVKRGNFYLIECTNSLDVYQKKYLDWSCSFADEQKAKYILEFQNNKENPILQCDVNSDTLEIKTWWDSGVTIE